MRSPNLRRRILPTVILGWIGWVLVVHEWRGLPEVFDGLARLAAPVAPAGWREVLTGWLARCGGLTVFALSQWACLAAGRRISAWGRAPRGELIALAAGWPLAGGAAAALALLGLARPGALVAAGVLLWAGSGGRARRPPRIPALPRMPRDVLERMGLAVCLVAGTVVVLASLAPDVEVDSLTYHAGKPLRALALGRFVARPTILYDYLPPLFETLLLPLFAAGGAPAARWLPPALVLWLGLGVAGLARRVGGPPWTTAALLVASPYLAAQSVLGKNDLLAAALALAAAQAALARRGARAPAIGWLAGAAFTVKYTTGGYLLPAGAAMLLAAGRDPRKALPRLLAGFAVPALCLGAHGWVRTGDPVYPAGHRFFASPWFTDTSAGQLAESLYGVTRQDPAAITWWRHVEEFWRTGEESFLRWALWLPALFVLPRWTGADRAVLGALAVLAAAWMTGPPPVRYGLALWPFGAVLAARGAVALSLPRRPGVGRAMLAVGLALQLAHTLLSPAVADALRAGAGPESSAGYRARRLTSLQDAATAAHDLARPGDRFLLVGDSRAALFPGGAEFAAFTRTTFTPYETVHGARDLRHALARLRQRGWTHLTYNRLGAFFWRRSAGADPWTERELVLWTNVWRARFEPVWESPTLNLLQGYLVTWRISRRPTRVSRAELPGVEGWIWSVEELIRAKRYAEARARFAVLRRVAGDFGVVDVIEAGIFHVERPPAERRRLLARAVARGWRSPVVYAELAGYAHAAGHRDEARAWLERARALEPLGDPRELLTLAARTAAEARPAR